ncbi:hypothetical protein CDAR_22241 [Caerostris darwini]|uniref:Uncharacterized protein n=1 Tax=Caerostris darwini TaxID=1538125 RepID=A0AAV4USY6_9ARAC|nr:hypothetical protein CDAR_22241 [Caerostris darwini]
MYRVQGEKRNPDSPSRKGPSGATVRLTPALLVAANDPPLSSSLAGERVCCGEIQSAQMVVMKRRGLWREIGGGGWRLSLSLFLCSLISLEGCCFQEKRRSKYSEKFLRNVIAML